MNVLKQKLDIFETLKEGFNVGLANFIPLFLATLLYVVTIWIPYLNVGTTIGIYRIILSLSKGERIDPVSIFNKENFSQIGDVFLLFGLMYIGTVVALIFLVIPAFVIAIAWSFAIIILLEKGGTSAQALSASYTLTFGNKWRIFFINLIYTLIIIIVAGLLSLIPYIGTVLSIIASLLFSAIATGIEATIYKGLNKV